MTNEEAIKRLKEFNILHTEQHGWDTTTLKALDMAIKALEFAEWVAEEIFSDDWEINKRAFFQIACRKLEKVGIVKLIDGHWVLVESEE